MYAKIPVSETGFINGGSVLIENLAKEDTRSLVGNTLGWFLNFVVFISFIRYLWGFGVPRASLALQDVAAYADAWVPASRPYACGAVSPRDD